MKSRKKITYVAEPPEGLFYIPRFVTEQEEKDLLSKIASLRFVPYDHHGYKANREVIYFGTEGDYGGEEAAATSEPLPSWLSPFRARFAVLVGLTESEIAMALVARYSSGAGIGWHRDRPQYGPSVFGISLSSDAEMRFRRFIDEYEEMFKINLEPRSAYIIGGPARSVWQHGMNPVKELRYSITFRTLKNRQNNTDIRHSPEQILMRLREQQLNLEPVSKDAPQVNQLKLML
jgi:DNA oxidative demethylase